MLEVELKFQVPPGARRAVEAAVAGRASTGRSRLVAVYVDTPERALAAARLALRLRREGRRWVQTLKGAADDGVTRLEHNVDRGVSAQAPTIDPALHEGTEAGARLAAALAAQPGAALQTIFTTDVRRRARRVRRGVAVLELCFDQGRIEASGRRAALCELEIELVSGPPQAVVDEARRWVARHGLWLDLRSKAERGDLLARDEPMVPPRGARGAELGRGMTAAQAWRAVVRRCTEQIAFNASQIASGTNAPEHVHQLRVGLRRLRSALRLFAADDELPPLFDSALGAAAAEWFRRLGAVRDQDVLRGPLSAALDAALESAGEAGGLATPLAAGAPVPAALVRDPASQRLLLDLIAAGLDAEDQAVDADAPPLQRVLARRVGRWHRRAARDAARYAELDDAARHLLRKRVKRLRYVVEFSAGLFDAGRMRRYLKPLRALQDQLGEINDVVMAQAACRAAREADPADTRAWFALGWLAARREALDQQVVPALAAFAGAKKFWTK